MPKSNDPSRRLVEISEEIDIAYRQLQAFTRCEDWSGVIKCATVLEARAAEKQGLARAVAHLKPVFEQQLGLLKQQRDKVQEELKLALERFSDTEPPPKED